MVNLDDVNVQSARAEERWLIYVSINFTALALTIETLNKCF